MLHVSPDDLAFANHSSHLRQGEAYPLPSCSGDIQRCDTHSYSDTQYSRWPDAVNISLTDSSDSDANETSFTQGIQG